MVKHGKASKMIYEKKTMITLKWPEGGEKSYRNQLFGAQEPILDKSPDCIDSMATSLWLGRLWRASMDTNMNKITCAIVGDVAMWENHRMNLMKLSDTFGWFSDENTREISLQIYVVGLWLNNP